LHWIIWKTPHQTKIHQEHYRWASRATARRGTRHRLRAIHIKVSIKLRTQKRVRISIAEPSCCQWEVEVPMRSKLPEASSSSQARTAWMLNSRWYGNSSRWKEVSLESWEAWISRAPRKATTCGRLRWLLVQALPTLSSYKISRSWFKKTKSSISEISRNQLLELQATLAWIKGQQAALSKPWCSSKMWIRLATIKRT